MNLRQLNRIKIMTASIISFGFGGFGQTHKEIIMSILNRKKKKRKNEKQLYTVKIFFYASEEVYIHEGVESSELDGIFVKALSNGVKTFSKSGSILMYFPPKRVKEMQVREE